MAQAPPAIYASDRDPAMVKVAQRMFQGAGVAIDVRLKQSNILDLEAPTDKGVMVINPPYGVRLSRSAAANLTQKLSDLEKALDVAPGDARLPEATILIVAGAQNLDVYGRQPLLFYPVLHATREVSSDTLRRAELIEFQKNDPVAAAALFREESRSRDPELRAAALVRLGRSLRKAGQIQEALAAYSELATMDSTPVSGLPAELVAREARCSLFEASAWHDDLRRESESRLGELESGRWRLTRSAYEFRAAEVRQWLGKDAAPPPADALAISDALENLTEQWLRNPEDSTGRRIHMARKISSWAV